MKPFHYCVCVGARLSAAVHEILLPIMKEIKNDLNSVKDDLNSVKNDLNSDLSSLNETVSGLIGDLEDYKQQTSNLHNTHNQQLTQLYTKMDTLDSKLDSVNASMREELRAIESQLEGQQMQMTSELAGLQSNVTSELAGLNTTLQSSTQQLTHLSTDVDTLDSKLDSVNVSIREDLRAIDSQLEEHQTQTTSKLAGLQTSLHYSTQQLTQLSTNMNTLHLNLNSVNASMREGFRAIDHQHEEHKMHITLELAELQKNVTSEVTELNTSLQASTQQLSIDVDTLDSKLDSVNVSMRVELRAIESQLEEHQTQTTSELAGLHLSLQSNTQELTNLSIDVGTLGSKLDTLDLNLNSVNVTMREELRAIESQIEDHQMGTTSELAELQGNVTSELAELNTTLQYGTQQLTHLSTDVNTLDSKLDSVNVSVREELRAIESQLEEHQIRTTSVLAELQSNVTSELAGLHTSLQSNSQQLTHLSIDVDTLDSKLDSVNVSMREELRAIGSQLEEHQTQTTSELAELQSNVTAELNTTLQSSTQQLTHLSIDMDTLDSKLDSVNVSIKEELRAIESQLEEHQTQTTSKLAGLHTSLQYSTQQQTQLSTNMDTLDMNLKSVNATMREELRAIKSQLEEHQMHTTSELAELQSNVTSELHTTIKTHTHNEQLITKMDTLESKFASVNASMREELRAIESELETHETHTLFTLAGLHSFLQSHTYTEELTEISTKVDTLDLKLDSVNNSDILIREDLSCIKEDLSSLNETMNRISEDVEEHDNHITTELTNIDQTLHSLSLYTCVGTGWRRVVYLNVTDPNTNCPSGWQLTSYSKRTCGRGSTVPLTCDSVTFPVSGGDYTRVCGKIIGYQYGHTDAFEIYHSGQVTTIEGAYVTGVSLTHGSPRQHIWTFAAGTHEEDNDDEACPCDTTYNINIPPFVSGDYFCESGVQSGSTSGFHPDDPLWDGDGCTASSTCCSFNSPPYFTKQLPSPTTDDVEVRICNYEGSSEDVPIEFIELYVQ